MSNDDKMMVSINLGNIDESYAELPAAAREAMVARVLSTAQSMRQAISNLRDETQKVQRAEELLGARLDDIGIAVALAECTAVSGIMIGRFQGATLMRDAQARLAMFNPIRIGKDREVEVDAVTAAVPGDVGGSERAPS